MFKATNLDKFPELFLFLPEFLKVTLATMDLSKIVTIAGRPGLFLVKSQAVGKIIVESLIDGKCSPAFARERMSSLEEISIYSVDEDRPLKEVFRSIHEKMGEKIDFDPKKATNDQLKAKFLEIMPDYDQDAVDPSDMKMVFLWYQMLMDKGLLDFTEEETPETETPEEAKPEGEA